MSKQSHNTSKPAQLAILPKDALTKVTFGDSFAEYDLLKINSDVFVSTNAYLAARDPAHNKCFFIGRRGTGKTALTIQLGRSGNKVLQVFPEVFAPLNSRITSEELKNGHQKPFKSVAIAFELALQFELLYDLLASGKIKRDSLPQFVQDELRVTDNEDFDLRVVRFVSRIMGHLKTESDTAWLRDIKHTKTLASVINSECSLPGKHYTIILDRLDESWDGSVINVRFLTALMHACGEFSTRLDGARALLFLRENVFERVREMDSEFARLETRVISLSWTPEKLTELVERRLNAPFNTRWPLGGGTWDTFFDQPGESRKLVFEFCQNRPRDVLTYVKFAIETAVSKGHYRIQIDDLLAARKRFSDSRLKDLCDEYEENFSQIQIVLDKFKGLGWRLSRQGFEAILQNLLVHDDIKRHCAKWFFSIATTDLFFNFLFQIGFLGAGTVAGHTMYRVAGTESARAPAVSDEIVFEVHPMYRDALDLQDYLVDCSPGELIFDSRGFRADLPDGLDLNSYTSKLNELEMDLQTLSPGKPDAYKYEDLVGNILRLCFFRSLANIEPKVRTYDGHTIRDWVAANRGAGGFWEMVRHKYGAVQVIWECKNYAELDASAFHQCAYYASEHLGRLVFVCFRGDPKEPRYKPHLRDILSKQGALVILLGDSDLFVFIRQARAGKVKDSHIEDRYDSVLRELS